MVTKGWLSMTSILGTGSWDGLAGGQKATLRSRDPVEDEPQWVAILFQCVWY